MKCSSHSLYALPDLTIIASIFILELYRISQGQIIKFTIREKYIFSKGKPMKSIFKICALIIAVSCTSVMAQYTGPNGTATTVKQLLSSGKDHDAVTLKGNIIKRIADEHLYEFNDGTGTMYISINQKRWPSGLKIDEKTKVEISGKYIKQIVGPTKVEVVDIHKAD